MTETTIAGLEALGRLVLLAQRDTGQARRVAHFLLAWYNAEENGGWDPTDLWNLDDEIARDLLAVLHLLHEEHAYPENLGFGEDLRPSGSCGARRAAESWWCFLFRQRTDEFPGRRPPGNDFCAVWFAGAQRF